MDLNLVRLIFTLKLEADCCDPYVFFGMRSQFRDAFRETAGCRERECSSCKDTGSCPYHRNFSQPLSPDLAAVKRHQKPSLPFVFDIPVLPPVPNRECMFELGLVVVGSAVHDAMHFVAAVGEMVRSRGLRARVAATLLKVESIGGDGARTVIMAKGEKAGAGGLIILSLESVQQGAVLSTDSITVTIMTPMQLMTEGKPAREISFSLLVRALLRRISSLAYYYGEEGDGLDYRWLAEQSRHIECVDANFCWMEWGRKQCGLLGSGIFSGDIAEYHPILQAGEYLHAGKGAAFGLGRFSVK